MGIQEITKKNLPIKNLNNVVLKKKDIIYHAGTKILNNQIVSNGGRVLNVTSLGKSFLKIRTRIIFIIKNINWGNGFYRKDIGYKVIKNNEDNKRIFKR